jgi:asparagine synthase (glutamine-hydrolysing)
MYAIAIWDKVTQELSLIRDPLGIKPIFYTRQHEALYFASEIKALRSLTSGRVARDGMVLYLYFGFIPAPYSLLEDVRKVQPGERLIFSPTGTRSESIKPNVWKHPEPLASTWTDRVQQVRAEVERAVKRQLIADVPVGVFLSGGIDSSLVCAAAQFALKGELRTFNVKFPEKGYDETWAAMAVAKHIRSRHEILQMDDGQGTWDQVTSLLLQAGQPFADTSLFAVNAVCRLMREHVTVALSGDGGDEGFGGYELYWQIAKIARLQRVPAPILSAAAAGLVPLGGRFSSLDSTMAVVSYPSPSAGNWNIE